VKKVKIIHLGIGKVGKTLVDQILKNKEVIRRTLGIYLIYSGLFNSKGGIFSDSGIDIRDVTKFPGNAVIVDYDKVISFLDENYIIVDTTASSETYGFLDLALKKSCYVAVSNKKPLCGNFNHFKRLVQKSERRFFYETTVGAGLPVIRTLMDLILTGDKIVQIQGCFSGTLGYIFSEIERGIAFSEAVKKAYELGYTEPDPRDDLSGLDVARKALILVRTMGRKTHLDEIKLTSLYPKQMEKLSVNDFFESLKNLDPVFQKRTVSAGKKGKTLRYVVTMDSESCRVGIEEVEKSSNLGSLKGPDNLIVFKTERYLANPLIIKGPGAGIGVTAAGVFADILEAAKLM